MSRKITNNTISAFNSNRAFAAGNTSAQVEHCTGKAVNPVLTITRLYLHGNEIAEKRTRKDGSYTLKITNTGWSSNVTKERLNGLPNVSIQQKAGVWYLNGKEWSGEWTEIK